MPIIHALAAAHSIVRWVRAHLAAPAPTSPTSLPAAGSAWTGPWPPGALPVCVSYGDGAPIFVGYVAASTEAGPRRAELCTFWRAHAATLEAHWVEGGA